MRVVFGWALLTLVVLATRGTGQEAVTVKEYEPKVGDKTRVTKTKKTVVKSSFVVMGQQKDKNEVKAVSFVYTQEVLEYPAGAKKPTKLKRVYEKAEVTKDSDITKLAFDGKTVLIEKKGEKYTFTYADGTVLTGRDAGDLENEFNKSNSSSDDRKGMMPDKPLKPGETWPIDTKKLGEALTVGGLQIDQMKLKATGTLIKTYKKDGATFGVLEMRFEIPVTGFGPKSPLVLKNPSLMTMTMTGDGCIDGTLSSGRMTGTNKLVAVGSVMGIDITIDMVETDVETNEPLGKK